MDPLSILLIFIFGILAGVVTGFLSASAAIVLIPFLSVGLGYETFTAIGISLATDVFASLFSFIVYLKNKNVQLRHGFVLSFSSLVGVVLGTFFAKDISEGFLSLYVSIFIIFLGIQLMKKPIHLRIKEFDKKSKLVFFSKYKSITAIVFGLLIGLIAGIFGGGGGLMILFTLTFVYKYKLHMALGTSILMMILIAFVGSVSHFYYTGIPYFEIVIAGSGGILGGVLTSIYANRINEMKLSKIIGILILCLGVFFVLRWFIG